MIKSPLTIQLTRPAVTTLTAINTKQRIHTATATEMDRLIDDLERDDPDPYWRCHACGSMNTARPVCLNCFAKRSDNPLPTSELEAMCSTDTEQS